MKTLLWGDCFSPGYYQIPLKVNITLDIVYKVSIHQLKH